MKKIIAIIITILLIFAVKYASLAPKTQNIATPATEQTTTPKPFSPYDLTLYGVDSDAISELGYDADEQVLVARWRNTGIRYAYYDVPEEVYNALMAADSLGSYFYYNVRMSYVYERLD